MSKNRLPWRDRLGATDEQLNGQMFSPLDIERYERQAHTRGLKLGLAGGAFVGFLAGMLVDRL